MSDQIPYPRDPMPAHVIPRDAMLPVELRQRVQDCKVSNWIHDRRFWGFVRAMLEIAFYHNLFGWDEDKKTALWALPAKNNFKDITGVDYGCITLENRAKALLKEFQKDRTLPVFQNMETLCDKLVEASANKEIQKKKKNKPKPKVAAKSANKSTDNSSGESVPTSPKRSREDEEEQPLTTMQAVSLSLIQREQEVVDEMALEIAQNIASTDAMKQTHQTELDAMRQTHQTELAKMIAKRTNLTEQLQARKGVLENNRKVHEQQFGSKRAKN